jgi:hypothetical protein
MGTLSYSLGSVVAGASGTFLGKADVSISGTFVGTVTLQRSFNDGATWVNITSYTAPIELLHENNTGGVLYRFNCTAFTSGSIVCRMSN